MVAFWITIGLVIAAVAAGIFAGLPLFANFVPYLFPDDPSSRGMGRFVRDIALAVAVLALLAVLVMGRIYSLH